MHVPHCRRVRAPHHKGRDHGRFTAARCGREPGGGLPGADRDCHQSLDGGWTCGRGGAADPAGAVRTPQAAIHPGEQGRRQRRDRRGRRGARRTGRLHAAVLARGADHDQPRSPKGDAIRFGAVVRADHAGCVGTDRDGGSSRPAHPQPEGIRGLRGGKSRQAVLWLGRSGQHNPPRWRDAGQHGKCQAAPCAVQGRGSGPDRPDG